MLKENNNKCCIVIVKETNNLRQRNYKSGHRIWDERSKNFTYSYHRNWTMVFVYCSSLTQPSPFYLGLRHDFW